MPAETASESRADESDFDRFDDLVLPSPEGKTLFVSITSSGEAEDEPDKEQEMTRSLVQGGESTLVDETDARGPACKTVQVVHEEWAQELQEVRIKFADDLASEMTDVKKPACACPRATWSSGPQREVRLNQGQDGARTNMKPMMLSTKPIFRRTLRISRRP